MNINRMVDDLRAAQTQINSGIGLLVGVLEQFQQSDGTLSVEPRGKGRGRKSMGAAERQEVSDRMKKYWTARRKEAARLKAAGEPKS